MDMKTLPLGLGMALAQNEAAMEAFAAMTEAEKQLLLQRAHQVRSKEEMRRLVSGLGGPSPVLDTDLGRDNLENDLPEADRNGL